MHVARALSNTTVQWDRRQGSLSSLTGEFANRQQEADFRTATWPEWHRRMCVVVLAGCAAFFITLLADYLLLDSNSFLMVLSGRLAVIVYGIGFVLLVSSRQNYRLSDAGLLIFMLMLITAFLVMVSVRPDGLHYSGPACILILMVFYVMPITRFWITLTSTLYVSIGILAVSLLMLDTPIREVAVYTVQLIAVNLIGYLITLRIHRDQRQGWLNRRTLETRERHQRLLANLSAQFLGMDRERIDDTIQTILNRLAEHAGSDRAYLAEFNPRHERIQIMHEWRSEDSRPATMNTEGFSTSRIPWVALKLQRGEVINIPDTHALPPEAALERELYQSFGVRSSLCVPLLHAGQLLGVIGLDRKQVTSYWDANIIDMLRVVGQSAFSAISRAKAESTLRQREAQYETLASLSPVGIFRTDERGYFQYANARLHQLTGLRTDQTLGNRWHSSLHPDDHARVTQAWNKAVASKQRFDDEFRFVRPDGCTTWVHCQAHAELDRSGELQGYVGTLDDITERKAARDELERRARLDEFTTSITLQFMRAGGLALQDTIQHVLSNIGHFTHADRAYLFQHHADPPRMSCLHEWCSEGTSHEMENLQDLPMDSFPWLSPQLLSGQTVSIPCVADLPPQAHQEKAEFERESIQSLVLVPITSSGRLAGFIGLDAVNQKIQWTADTILLLRIAGEAVLNELQQKQLQETQKQRADELQKLNDDLARSNQELHRLAYVASHDLQEPLRAVSGFASLLQRDYGNRLDAKADEYIRFITESATRLQQLINDLLAYTRLDKQTLNTSACDLNQLAKVVMDNLADPIRQSGAHIQCDPLPRLNANPLQIIELLQQLLSNALKFCGKDKPRIRIHATTSDAEHLLSIEDNGPGIERGYREKVFGVFERLHTRDNHPGNGIGLALCRRIVDLHGGRIWIEQNWPSGCVVRISLPRTDAHAHGPLRPAATHHAA